MFQFCLCSEWNIDLHTEKVFSVPNGGGFHRLDWIFENTAWQWKVKFQAVNRCILRNQRKCFLIVFAWDTNLICSTRRCVYISSFPFRRISPGGSCLLVNIGNRCPMTFLPKVRRSVASVATYPWFQFLKLCSWPDGRLLQRQKSLKIKLWNSRSETHICLVHRPRLHTPVYSQYILYTI